MIRRIVVFLLLIAVAAPAYARMLSEPEERLLKDALNEAADGDWISFEASMEAARTPLLKKYLSWIYYKSPGSGATLEAIEDFHSRNSDWPGRESLQRAAETAIDETTPFEEIESWFRAHPPQSGRAKILYAAVLANGGSDDQQIKSLLREGWEDPDLDEKTEQLVRDYYLDHLRPLDHAARVDALLWEEDKEEARAMLPLLDQDTKALAMARLYYMGSNSSNASPAVPPRMEKNEGYLYAKASWFAEHGKEDALKELLRNLPAPKSHAESWWKLRAPLARDLLMKGNHQSAYSMIARHGLERGEAFAEAEWLAGFIAFEFLHRYEEAYTHFTRLAWNTEFPVSQSRADFWASRCAEKLGFKNSKDFWLERAARFPTTFYGQLAIESLRLPFAIPPQPSVTEEMRDRFFKREVVRVAHMLAEAGRDEELRLWLYALIDKAANPMEHALLAEIGGRYGLPHFSVKAAKRSFRKQVVLTASSYPTLSIPATGDGVEPALALGVIRQESEFNQHAESPSNALGLMQLLPSTARLVAKRHDIPFDENDLTRSARRNMELGSLYLAKLLDQFDGSYILTIAAYNAGPGRARQWENQLGTPGISIDPITWIEMIPYAETRNYVQRVLENTQVYRELAKPDTPLQLLKDLYR